MFAESLYVATSLICKIPLASKVPDSNAAGILNLSNIIIKMSENKINTIR